MIWGDSGNSQLLPFTAKKCAQFLHFSIILVYVLIFLFGYKFLVEGGMKGHRNLANNLQNQ
jgi:hypothetical protein